MKKLILAFLAMGTLAAANAQESHSILLYGDVNLQTQKNPDESKTTNWDANIGVGYQFNHNWTLGLKVMWGQDATKEGNNPAIGLVPGEKNTDNMYSVGPFARYSKYIGKSETFYWYSQLDFDYQGGYHTNEGNAATDKHTGMYLGLYPAIGMNVGHGMGLNFSIGGINYSSDKNQNYTNATTAFNFTFGHMVNVGLSKNFNCGHKMHSHHEPGDEVHRRKAEKMEDEDDAAPKPKKKDRSRDDDE